MSAESHDVQQFRSEIKEAIQLIESSLADLPLPLKYLVDTAAASAFPPVRVGLVLAIGVGERETQRLRQQRISLAAALEMLHVALQVHRLLSRPIGANDDYEPDKSIIGSTILAGDYCFSRSAQLAAQTDNPRAVDIFAGALRDVSESQLKRVFRADDPPLDDNEILFRAGVLAVSELTGVQGHVLSAAVACGSQLAGVLRTASTPAALRAGLSDIDSRDLSRRQYLRWRQLTEWLSRRDPAA